MTLVLRVETRMPDSRRPSVGVGPYRPDRSTWAVAPLFGEWVMAKYSILNDTYGLPEPHEDFGFNRAAIHSRPDMVCGFKNETQLFNWFSRTQLAHMAMYDFVVSAYEVDGDVWSGPAQVMFDSSRADFRATIDPTRITALRHIGVAP